MIVCPAADVQHLALSMTKSALLAGMVPRALDIIEAWSRISCPKQGLKGITDDKPLQPVPRWMDALLLLVNSCTTIIWKEPAPENSADKPKATEPQVEVSSEYVHQE